jgi:hypothetical protein
MIIISYYDLHIYSIPIKTLTIENPDVLTPGDHK